MRAFEFNPFSEEKLFEVEFTLECGHKQHSPAVWTARSLAVRLDLQSNMYCKECKKDVKIAGGKEIRDGA